MTQEQGGLADLDLNDLFGVLDNNLRTNKKLGDLPTSTAIANPSIPQPEMQSEKDYPDSLIFFQVNLILEYFNGKTISDIRLAAKDFKTSFEAHKKSILGYNDNEKLKRQILDTNLESLADNAKRQHELAVKKSGQSLPESQEESANRSQADMWGIIYQVVQEAAEIKD